MSVTKEQAVNAAHRAEFHYGICKVFIGQRGGREERIERWRGNGDCIVWKTRPEEFKLPVKHGLYSFGYITHENAHDWHQAKDCKPIELNIRTAVSVVSDNGVSHSVVTTDIPSVAASNLMYAAQRVASQYAYILDLPSEDMLYTFDQPKSYLSTHEIARLLIVKSYVHNGFGRYQFDGEYYN